MKKIFILSAALFMVAAGCNSSTTQVPVQTQSPQAVQNNTPTKPTTILNGLKFSFDSKYQLGAVTQNSDEQYVSLTLPGKPYNTVWNVGVKKIIPANYTPAIVYGTNKSVDPDFQIPNAKVYNDACGGGYCKFYTLIFDNGHEYSVYFGGSLDTPPSNCKSEDCMTADKPADLDAKAIISSVQETK